VSVPNLVVATLLAMTALLVSERRASRAGVWVAKPLASTGFVATAVVAGALETSYGAAVLTALVLCWLGDVLLIPRGASKIFLAGLVSFLLGHVGFAVAFAMRGPEPLWMIGAALVLLPVALGVLRWLHPHLPEVMRAPVVAYVVVISLMLVTAVGAAAATGRATIAVGGFCFYLSDLHVARDRFVSRSFWNKSWGLPLYYGAQLILACTVSP
jgi:uncharacterized membrane protein YhhN